MLRPLGPIATNTEADPRRSEEFTPHDTVMARTGPASLPSATRRWNAEGTNGLGICSSPITQTLSRITSTG